MLSRRDVNRVTGRGLLSPLERRGGVGFTLVELLVVIGIIGVLISILLPTLSRVRAQANDVVCQSNLRQIGVATQAYAVDNRDRFPYTSYGGGSSKVQGALGDGFARRGYNNIDPVSGLPEVTSGYPAAFYRLGYLKSNNSGNSVWLCPSAIETVREFGNSYRWYASTVVRDGTSIDRSRGGKTAMWVADNVELNVAKVVAGPDAWKELSSVLPKPLGQVQQYFPHYTRSIIKMGFDGAGKQYAIWRDPRRGIPVLYTLFVDGHVARQVGRSNSETVSGTFAGFAPAVE